MTDDLFQVPPTPATPLQKARARLAKAEAEFVRADRLYDEQGDVAWYLVENAKNELSSAKNSAQVEEQRALALLRASERLTKARETLAEKQADFTVPMFDLELASNEVRAAENMFLIEESKSRAAREP